jgi:hypothetical protein
MQGGISLKSSHLSLALINRFGKLLITNTLDDVYNVRIIKGLGWKAVRRLLPCFPWRI